MKGWVQPPSVNHCTSTVPAGPGWPGTPVTVTKSCTVVPAATEVTVPPPALLWIAVAVDVGTGFTSVAAPAPVKLIAVLQGNPETGLSQTCRYLKLAMSLRVGSSFGGSLLPTSWSCVV